jgi:NitT/TauT family transport system permease protein
MARISRHSLGDWAKGLAVIVLLLVAWGVAALLIDNSYILPTLGQIATVLLHPLQPLLGGESLVANTMVSLREVLTGFLVAAALAIPIGLLVGWSRETQKYLNPTIQALRPIPPIAWMPFAIAWFGIGMPSILFIIGIGAFFPLLINTVDGVQAVRVRWTEVAEMFHATTFEKLRTVVLPGALPRIWTGLRVAFGIAWMCVVAAEMMPGTNSGLGYLILYAYNFSQVQVIIAGMIVIGLIGLGIDIVLRQVEQRRFRWRSLER